MALMISHFLFKQGLIKNSTLSFKIMNFLIEFGFYLCTFNLKVFECIHSSCNYPRQAFNVSCWCFYRTIVLLEGLQESEDFASFEQSADAL